MDSGYYQHEFHSHDEPKEEKRECFECCEEIEKGQKVFPAKKWYPNSDGELCAKCFASFTAYDITNAEYEAMIEKDNRIEQTPERVLVSLENVNN